MRHHTQRHRPAFTAEVEAARRVDTPTAAARDLGPCVYAVRTRDGLIKIGHTGNLDRRIRQFRVGWSDVLLALPGTRDDEAAIHARFTEHVARGHEYYHPAEDILEWINTERRRLGVPGVAA